MSPPRDATPRVPLIGGGGLASRWGISAEALRLVLPRLPHWQEVDGRRVWVLADIEAWEAAERAAGRAVPGERPRGPAPSDPARRPSVPETPGEGIDL